MEQYGDLSEQEYLSFLNEIEDDDINISAEAVKLNIELEQEDFEASLDTKEQNTSIPKSVKQVTSYNRRKAIQRAAFNQNKLSLADEIPKYELTELIKILTKTTAQAVSRYESWINKKLARSLRPFIPGTLRFCFYKYPQSVVPCPGFLYKASEEYGGGTQIWAKPNIPYYIPQGTELDLLKSTKPDILFSIDKLVAAYNRYNTELRKKELRYAGTLISKKITTYYSLLKVNPFWFNRLYNYKFNEYLIDSSYEF